VLSLQVKDRRGNTGCVRQSWKGEGGSGTTGLRWAQDGRCASPTAGGEASDEIGRVGHQVREGGETVKAQAGLSAGMSRRARGLEDCRHEALEGPNGRRLTLKLRDGQVAHRETETTDASIGRGGGSGKVRARDSTPGGKGTLAGTLPAADWRVNRNPANPGCLGRRALRWGGPGGRESAGRPPGARSRRWPSSSHRSADRAADPPRTMLRLHVDGLDEVHPRSIP